MNSFVNERDRYKLNLFAKAATTTMKLWFWYDLEGRHEEFVSDPPERPVDRQGRRIRIHQHVNPLAVRHHLVPADYQIFTVARNPFSRLLSAYRGVIKNKVARRKFLANKTGRAVPSSFAEFVEMLYRQELGTNVHWQPQSHLLGPAGNILRVENLAADFDMLCEKLGKKKGTLPRYNIRRSRDPADYYTAESAAIVRHLYAGDFERFGFSTEVPEALRAPSPSPVG